jgi:hypothetical protein
MKIHGGLIEMLLFGRSAFSNIATSEIPSNIKTTDTDNRYFDQQHQIWVVGSSPSITNQNQRLPAMWHVVGSGHSNDLSTKYHYAKPCVSMAQGKSVVPGA